MAVDPLIFYLLSISLSSLPPISASYLASRSSILVLSAVVASPVGIRTIRVH